MTSTRKTLMIAGGLLVAAAGTAYVMLLRADHRAIEDAGIGDSAAPVAVAPANNDHAVQGTIAPPAPAAAAPQQQAAVPPPSPAPAPAPAAPARVSAAPPSAPAVPVVSDKAQPVTKPGAPPPKVNVVTVDAQDSTPPAPPPAAQQAQPAAPAQVTQRAPRKRDGLERHATATTKSETPETAALVRESAKLDPSLPAPPMSSMPASAGSYRQGSSSSGANPVAAAMTEQLVRASSNFKSTTPAPANGDPTATK
ncbi:extensin [Burkholderia arboris]|uniref:Extensin n=1 Tax=Burkholderia arboris TaxID=488730 RepID=A0ABZ3DVL8_9BURK